MTDRYILNGHDPVRCNDLYEWARFIERPDRIVAQEHVGPFWVSTVFLGLDHRFGNDGPPILFETGVFVDKPVVIHFRGKEIKSDGLEDQWMERCSTWDEAVAQHQRGVAWAKERYEALQREVGAWTEMPTKGT
jgi:hypothetical protein